MAKNCKPSIIIPDKYSVVVVQNIAERNNISCKIRQNGTIAVVVEEGYAQYQIRTQGGLYSVCDNNAWVQISTGNKVFDGSNLIILNNEEHKQKYLQSGLAVVGQMIFYVPENKYYRYDGYNFVEPFYNKLDKGGYEGTAQDLKNDIETKQKKLSSFDESILIETDGNIEGNISLFSEYFNQQICELNFIPIQIVAVYQDGIKLLNSEYEIILPKKIKIKEYVDENIQIEYTHLKS